jgi:cation transport regulator ChaC
MIGDMSETKVWVFFYGSYMNREVLKEVNLVPERWETARLSSFDIIIRPRANLIRSAKHNVYGIVATATHRELERLYAHARDVLGEVYQPEAVLVETMDGKWQPALCYIAPAMEPRPAAADYVERIVAPAKAYGFPKWNVQRIEAFRPRVDPG